jgi:hypothetical protein
MEAWIEAQNILYRAHQQFEDDDRIQFVRELERQEVAQSGSVETICVRPGWILVSRSREVLPKMLQRAARFAFAAFAVSQR